MTKKIMSIAAIAAIFTTGANAFDATQGHGKLMKETSATAAVQGTYFGENNATINHVTALARYANPGQPGDALIFPAFFSNNGFSTEFSVINTSSTEAVVAKVVLYSAVNSNELRDFNIYLSANDVFRATIKDGKITSTDGSTVVVGSDGASVKDDHGFKYTDNATMASTTTPFETSVGEDIGYIGVFGMVQAERNTTISPSPIGTSKHVDARYHQKHLELWRDYRHLVDQCRTENWRSGITNGIYTGAARVTTPNIDANNSIRLSTTPEIITGIDKNCTTLQSSAQLADNNRRTPVHFTGVGQVLTGSIIVSGTDSKGTRAMTLQPTTFANFSDKNNTVLWTEGELATIFDRCIESNATYNKTDYNATCVQTDAGVNRITSTLYEFGSVESKLLVTQPWKRVLVQMNGDGATLPFAGAWNNVNRQSTANGIVSGADNKDFNIKDYGVFNITQTVYNDDEDQYIGTSGGFTVSPASTSSTGIANEMAMFDPLPGGANYPKGYSWINYTSPVQHGIVTQMTANEIDGSAEINWIYPVTR